MLKENLKNIPILGWLLRFVNNIIRLNNLKHFVLQLQKRMDQEEIKTLEQDRRLDQEEIKTLEGDRRLDQEEIKTLEQDNRLNSYEREMQELKNELSSIKSILKLEVSKQMRSHSFIMYKKIENILCDDEKRMKVDTHTVQEKMHTAAMNDYYLEFEEVFRGSQELISKRCEEYLPYISLNAEKALDIGCGRGEWVGLLQKQGVDSYGVDLNASMIDAGKIFGIKNLHQEDAFKYLKSIDDDTFDLVSAFHIVEHIPFEDLFVLFKEIQRVAKPEATILMETPNPKNIRVGAYTFYRDPTHLNPLPAEVLSFMLEYVGFIDVHVEFIHPNQEEEPLEIDSKLAQKINDYFYEGQDYLVIAKNTKQVR